MATRKKAKARTKPAKRAANKKNAKASDPAAQPSAPPAEPVDVKAVAAPSAQLPAGHPNAESAVPVLQDWTPLSHCLDYQLGQVAFQQRGAQAFTTNEVPNLINQGGMSAYRAAEVFYAHCGEAEEAGTLGDDIVCLEIAMGLGLASLQLLDRFKALCTAGEKDWYDRLTWYATDATPKMVTDARDNAVFERHKDVVVLGLVDAMRPSVLRRIDTEEVIDLTGKLRALFNAYLLSLLPSNVLHLAEKADDDGNITRRWGIVMARTVLRQADSLSKFTNLTLDGLRTVLGSGDFGAAMGIVHLYPLFDLDLTLAEVTADQYEGFAEVERIAANINAEQNGPLKPGEERKTWVLHSSGATVSLRLMLELLQDDGMVLFRDYGPATASNANRSHLYQHYGAATATGLNHFAFDTMYALPLDQGGCAATVSIPEGEGEAPIKNRLVARAALPKTRAAFLKQFERKAFATLEKKMNEARTPKSGLQDVMEHYRNALMLERDNWALLTEAAEVALRRFEHVELAEMFSREAIRINPWYNPLAWNVLGDIAAHRGDGDSALFAYNNAVKNNPEHWRGWFGLYLVHRQTGNFAEALNCASKALANDSRGEQRERLKGAVQDAAGLLAEQQTLAMKFRLGRQAGAIN